MEWLTWFFFESLPALGATLGVVLFILLVFWRRTGRVRPLLIALGVAAVLLVVQTLVVTQREHADRILRAIERDLVASRADALAAALAPNFESGGLDRNEFLSYVQRQLSKVRVRWVERTGLRIEDSQADRFIAAASYWADILAHDFPTSPRTGWAITFVRTPSGWRIGEIRCRYIESIRDPSWRDIDRQ